MRPEELKKFIEADSEFPLNPDFDYEMFYNSLVSNTEELLDRLETYGVKGILNARKRYRIIQYINLIAEARDILESEEYFEQ